MTKIRPCGSRFEAIDRTAAALGGYDAAAAVIGKSHGYLRDAGDQDRDNVELKVWEAERLDVLLVAAGGEAVFGAHLRAVAEAARPGAPDGTPFNAFLQTGAAFGRLCAEMDAAIQHDSEDGHEIGPGEAARALDQLTRLEEAAGPLRRHLLAIVRKGRR